MVAGDDKACAQAASARAAKEQLGMDMTHGVRGKKIRGTLRSPGRAAHRPVCKERVLGAVYFERS